MPRVYVSIGSNIDREQNIRGALHDLRNSCGHLIRSRVYETPAVGFTGDPFYNLVVAFDTTDSIDQVISELARIETAHGRRREAATGPSLVRGPRTRVPGVPPKTSPIVDGLSKFSARTLDLDILLYGDLIRHDSGFDIPRGEILERDFVLGPLAEIAPDLKHPEAGETFDVLWKRFRQVHPQTHLKAVNFEE